MNKQNSTNKTPISKAFVERTELNTKEAIDQLSSKKPKNESGIVQHGKGSQVYNITHEGEGDIIQHNSSELKKLRAEIKLYKKLIEELQQCVEVNKKEHDIVIKTKNDEIRALREMIEMLKARVEKM